MVQTNGMKISSCFVIRMLDQNQLKIFVEEAHFNKLQTGLRWDNHHELIAVTNIKTNDIFFPGLLIKNEFQFPGILKNTFEISYPRTLFNNPYYPFYRNLYYKKDFDIQHILEDPPAYSLIWQFHYP